MNIQAIFMPLIHNKHWREIRMCLTFVILSAQTTYSYAVPQTFPGSTPTIEAKYNRDTGQTTVAAKTILEESFIETGYGSVKEFISLIVAYKHNGRRLTSPPNVVTLLFTSQSRQPRFGEQTELLSIIDGERLGLGRMHHAARDPLVDILLFQSTRVEYLGVEAPLETFLKLARARTVILIIGNKELKLGEQNFNVLSAIANRMTGKAVASTTSSGAETANSTSIGGCPIQASNLLALHGFKLGMSIQEVSGSSQGNAPPLSEPDSTGVRSMEARLSGPQKLPGSISLDQIEFKFLDERVFVIEAKHTLGEEWKDRLEEFAYSISKGLGVSATWKEHSTGYAYSKQFAIECDAVYMYLNIDFEEAFRRELKQKLFGKKTISGSREPWVARAILKLIDPDAESLLHQRRAKNRQKER